MAIDNQKFLKMTIDDQKVLENDHWWSKVLKPKTLSIL